MGKVEGMREMYPKMGNRRGHQRVHEDMNVKRGVMLQLDNITVTHHALCKRTAEQLAESLMVT